MGKKEAEHIYSGILLNLKKWNLTICRPKVYYVKWNKSDRECKYCIISLICELKNEQIKQNRNNKLIRYREQTDGY